MVIRELLKKADRILSEKGIEDSYNESAILFAYAMNETKTYIFTHLDDDASDEVEVCFLEFIEKRSKYMPVAYIMNNAWFMSLEFYVNEFTLIPRPETEELVEEVISYLKDNSKNKIDMLDMCTGSGCIGIAVASYDERVQSTLSDISPECIKVSNINIEKNNLTNQVEAVKSDLFNSFTGLKFDVITINPPYIPTDDIKKLDEDVRIYEPISALVGGVDGLDFYRRIAAEAKSYLKTDGCIFMEIGINQSEAVSKILEQNGYSNIKIKNDISRIPRIISAF